MAEHTFLPTENLKCHHKIAVGRIVSSFESEHPGSALRVGVALQGTRLSLPIPHTYSPFPMAR